MCVVLNFLLILELFPAHHAVDAHDDERYAQYLSHVEPCGAIVGTALCFFQEFDEEAEEEDGSQAEPEVEARSDAACLGCVALVDNPSYHEDGEVGNGFV